MIKEIMEVGSSIKNGRTIQDVAIKLAEEFGEVMGSYQYYHRII